MPIIVLFFCAVSALASSATPHWRDSTFDYRSEDPGSDSLQTLSKLRLGAVAGLTAVSFGASYFLVLKNDWWNNSEGGFHFANDFDYAKNLDKGGHFFAGVALGEFFYEGYHWAGLSEFQSYFWAGVSAGLTHVGIDIKDGFSPEWGYSVGDVLSGTLGGFWPMAERYVPAFRYFDYKWSYWINSSAYYDQSETDLFADDYVNQTHWLSVKVDRLLPQSWARFWPDGLALATGVSIDEGVYTQGQGHGRYEWYVGPDWDLEGLFKPKSRWARKVVNTLNYIRFPAPTLQVYPYRRWHWAYPIIF